MKEITRIKGIEFNTHTSTITCFNCGKEIELYFNGGELDRQECCGYEYSLEHTQIDLVIYKNIN